VGGRKFCGAFDPAAGAYSVCAVLRPDDDPSRLGAERGTLPGGRYARVRLQGDPPWRLDEIGPTAERLAQRPNYDQTRPTLECYRRRDVIDVLVPVV
jgi:DNA gyrase inhibitor GyrI